MSLWCDQILMAISQSIDIMFINQYQSILINQLFKLAMIRKTFILIIILTLLCTYWAQSVEPVWSRHPDVRIGTVFFTSTTAAGYPMNANIPVVYQKTVSNVNLMLPSIAIYEMDLDIISYRLQFWLKVNSFQTTGFNANFLFWDAGYFRKLSIKYMTVDRSNFQYVGSYYWSLPNSLTGPFQTANNHFNLNSQDNSITVLNSNHNIKMLCNMIALDYNSNYGSHTNYYNAQAKYCDIDTGSFTKARVVLQTRLQCIVNYAAYSVLIIDLTELLQNYPMWYFANGRISTIGANAAALIVSRPLLLQDNFFIGLTSFYQIPTTQFNLLAQISTDFMQYAASLNQYDILTLDYFYQQNYTCLPLHPYFNSATLKCMNDQCQAQFYFDVSSLTCEPCIGVCYQCSDISTCTSCYPSSNRQLDSFNTCQPKIGYYQTGDPIAPPCSSSCKTCQISDIRCTSCYSPTHFYTSSNNLCNLCTIQYCNLCQDNTGHCADCHPDYLPDASGICIEIPCNIKSEGCLLCQRNNPDLCQRCDQANGYIINTGTLLCDAVCGDGIFITAKENCQDGNLDKMDGCSDTCQIQNGFDCSGILSSGLSDCTYILPINFTVTHMVRIQNANQINATIMISPLLKFFQTHDFTKSFRYDLQIQNLQFVYDPSTGKLDLIMDFQQSLQDKLGQITFDAPNVGPFRLTPSSSLLIQLKPADEWQNLKYFDNSYYAIASVTRILGITVSTMAWIIFFTGLYMGKIIGIQTITAIQVVFFSLLTVKTQFNPCFAALSGLSYSNGISIFSFEPYPFSENLLPFNYEILNLYVPLIKNYNLDIALFFLPIIAGVITLILGKTKFAHKGKQINELLNKFLLQIPLAVLFASEYIIFSSLGIQLLFGISTLSQPMDLVGLIFGGLLVLTYVIYFIQLCRNPRGFGEFKLFFSLFIVHSQKFYLLVMIKIAILALVLSISQSSFGLIAIFALLISESVIIIVKRHYQTIGNNVRAVANNVIVMLCVAFVTFLAFSQQDIMDTNVISFYAPLIIIILLLVMVIYNLVFIVLFIRQNFAQAEQKEQIQAEVQKLNEQRIKTYHQSGMPNMFFVIKETIEKEKAQKNILSKVQKDNDSCGGQQGQKGLGYKYQDNLQYDQQLNGLDQEDETSKRNLKKVPSNQGDVSDRKLIQKQQPDESHLYDHISYLKKFKAIQISDSQIVEQWAKIGEQGNESVQNLIVQKIQHNIKEQTKPENEDKNEEEDDQKKIRVKNEADQKKNIINKLKKIKKMQKQLEEQDVVIPKVNLLDYDNI